jgi:dipeptide/tripeptide permease
METTTVTVATLVGNVGTIFEAAIGWVGTVATTIAGEPMLLLFASIPLIGLGVGLFKRLLNVN